MKGNRVNRSMRIARSRDVVIVIAMLAALTAASCYEVSKPADERAEEIDLKALQRFEPSVPEPSPGVEPPRPPLAPSEAATKR